MKRNLLFFALGPLMWMTACQKDESLSSDANNSAFAPPASDRCGCMRPVIFNTQNKTDVSVDILWNAMPEAVAYRIELSKRDFLASNDDDFSNAHVIETTEDEISLANLSPDTRYKFRVTTICRVMESSVSETMFFETKTTPHGDPDKRYKYASAAK